MQPFEQMEANFPILLLIKLNDIFPMRVTVETVLQSKTICNSEFFPHYDSACSELSFFDLKLAIFDAEKTRVSGQYSGVKPYFGPRIETAISCFVAPVNKRVLFARVAMEVTVQQKVSLLAEDLHDSLDVKDRGVQVLVRRNPLSVEVHPSQGGSVIAAHNTVRVEHWH